MIDIEGVDVSSYVENARTVVQNQLNIPSGYSITWSGQYEYMERAKKRLMYVVPLTLAIIALLLFLNFRRFAEVIMLMGTMPLALIGSVWLMYLQGFHFSIAVGVGFIALAGVAVEIGVIMLVYLNMAAKKITEQQQTITVQQLKQAIVEGAGMRVRPVMMTAASIIIGLLPILYGTGTGSEVMSRIAAPMVGGMLSSLFLSLLILPVVLFSLV